MKNKHLLPGLLAAATVGVLLLPSPDSETTSFQVVPPIGQPLHPTSIAPEPAPSSALASGLRTALDSTDVTTLHAVDKTIERISALLESDQHDQIGDILHEFLASAEDPVAAITETLAQPLLRSVDAMSAGLILQTAIRYALDGEAILRGVDPVDLASVAMGFLDASEYSSRALLFGMGSLGAELPGHLIGDLVRGMRSSDLVHVEVESQLDRLRLLRSWSESMDPEAAHVLHSLALDPESSVAVRAGGVLGLMTRDWRTYGPDLAELFVDLRKQGLDTSSGAGFLLMANLSGTNLALEGRDRLELLREVIGDADLATYALNALPEDMRRDLLVYANEEDRAWGPFRWVDLAGEGERAVQAGYSLLEDTRSDPNVARGYVLVQRLMELDATDPRLQDELEWRYSQRDSRGDLFWGLLDFNQAHLPESVRAHQIPRFLERTSGDLHPTRARVLQRLRESHPHLAAGLN